MTGRRLGKKGRKQGGGEAAALLSPPPLFFRGLPSCRPNEPQATAWRHPLKSAPRHVELSEAE